MTEMPASSRKCRRYMRNVSSSTSPISSGRSRKGTGALTQPIFPDGMADSASPPGASRRPPRERGGSGLGWSSRACRLLLLVLGRRELQPVLALDFDQNRVAAGDLAAEQVLGELVLDPAGDHAPQRPRAVDP